MIVLLVYNIEKSATKEGRAQINRYIKAFKVCGAKVVLANEIDAVRVAREKAKYIDFAFIYNHDYCIVDQIETLGIKCINPAEAFQYTNDVGTMYTHLLREGAPIPKTVFLPARTRLTNDSYLALVKSITKENHLTFPFIIKRRLEGVVKSTYFVDSEEALVKAIKENRGYSIVAQEYFKEKESATFRYLVIGGKIKYSLRKTFSKYESTSLSQIKWVKTKTHIAPNVKGYVRKAANAVNAKVATVDVTFDAKANPYIINVDVMPKTIGIDHAYKRSATFKVAEHCCKIYKKLPIYK